MPGIERGVAIVFLTGVAFVLADYVTPGGLGGDVRGCFGAGKSGRLSVVRNVAGFVPTRFVPIGFVLTGFVRVYQHGLCSRVGTWGR